MKILCFFIVYQFAIPSIAQFVDNFSDGDFTNDPVWSGEGTKFTIYNNQLRLQAPAVTDDAYLSTPSASINQAEWRFTLKLDFNPSSSNYSRIYLTSDQLDLKGSLNGYFVLVGDTPDEVSLYRQSGSSRTKIIDGTDGTVNLSVVNLSVKVTRDNLGNWELFSDVGNTGSYNSEGTVFDNTFTSSAYAGVYCDYTSTRSDKFYFDDFTVTGDPYQDIVPPMIESVESLSSNTILIRFNEALNSASATSPENYIVNNSIGSPLSAALQPDQLSVLLTFNTSFTNGISNELTVTGITDLTGNSISSSTIPFLFFQPGTPHKKDIIFSEVFPDPSPQVSLPDAEYIELYNRSNVPFDLGGWKITDGSSTATFATNIILPHTYWLITSSTNASKFGSLQNLIAVSNFPTLNNASDALSLKTPDDLVIDSINYSLDWYKNIDKQEGGWSLELIDPENICSEENNWAASENENGGTPGAQNSILANKPDLTGPKLVSVVVQSPTQLQLSFDEKLESPINNSVNFNLSPLIGIASYAFESNSLRSIIAVLADPLTTGQLYTLSVENLFDCSGNLIQAEYNRLSFAIPEPADPGDLIINEILFNPRPNGVDFIELYNKSSKYISLKGWAIANYESDSVTNSQEISNNNIIGPQEYLVLTSDPIVLKTNYPQGIESTFRLTKLPSLPDDEGSAAIISSEKKVIDYFLYEKGFHSEFVKDEEGVSLERISISATTNDPSNWNSASSTSGFATPGFINSSFRPTNFPADEDITIDPQIFAPNSGVFDFSKINFHFEQAGFIANVKVFDYQGRLIKTLANNETLGYEGSFKWEGDLDDGNKARAGYYFVWFEVFNTEGTVKTFRKRVVVASR